MFSHITLALGVILAACPVIVNADIDFTSSLWIWGSDAVSDVAIQLPVETRSFRKDIATGSSGKLPTSVEVVITADDAYTLYINGAHVGSGSGYRSPQYYCVRANPVESMSVFGKRVVIAVSATNFGDFAGLMATIKINYLGGGSEQFVTDWSWVTSSTVPTGFQATDFDDSMWDPVVVEAQNSGLDPWYFIAPPDTAQTCQ